MKTIKIFLILLFFSLNIFAFDLEKAGKVEVSLKVTEIDTGLYLGEYSYTVFDDNAECDFDRYFYSRLVEVELVNEHATDPIDKWKPVQKEELKASIILLPPSASNFDFFKIGELKESIAGYLAYKGMDVYGYSPRTMGILENDCSLLSFNKACKKMKTWDLLQYHQDIDKLREEIAKTWKDEKPFIFGFSMGGIIEYTLLNKDPGAYQGAIIYDGLIYLNPNNDQEKENFIAEYKMASYTFAIASNFQLAYSMPSSKFRKAHKNNSILNSDQIISEDTFNEKLSEYYDIFNSVVNAPFGLSPWYRKTTPSEDNHFKYASEAKINSFAARVNYYDIGACYVDIYKTFSRSDEHYKNLYNYTAPTLIIEAGNGVGDYTNDSIKLLGSEEIYYLMGLINKNDPFENINITIADSSQRAYYRYLDNQHENIFEDFAHFDHWAHENSLELLVEPVWEFIYNIIQ
ncbi:MAG: alpha/beta hydrolase [Pseudomonadota bacterium]